MQLHHILAILLPLLALAALLLPALRARPLITASNVQVELTFVDRYLVGADVYFAENGTTISAAEVTSAAKPNVATNYEAVPKIGCVVDYKHRPVTEDVNKRKCWNGTRYEERYDRTTVADFLDLTLDEINELALRMIWGKPAIIVAETAFQPFTNGDRKVTGWLFLDIKKPTGTGATAYAKAALWVDARVVEPAPTDSQGAPTKFEIEILTNALNTVEYE